MALVLATHKVVTKDHVFYGGVSGSPEDKYRVLGKSRRSGNNDFTVTGKRYEIWKLAVSGIDSLPGSTDSKICRIKNIVMIFKPDAMKASTPFIGVMETKVLKV